MYKRQAKTNKFKAPTWSVIASAAIVQFFIVVIYINASAYQAVYALSTSAIMVPYVFSAFYYLKLVIRGEGLEEGNHNKAGAWIIAIIGSVYGVWLLYASGVTYILAATILYAPGTLMYLYNSCLLYTSILTLCNHEVLHLILEDAK